MRISLVLAPALAASVLSACIPDAGGGRPGYAGDRYQDRHGRNPRYLHDEDVIYRDRDGRYYCKRSDGTTGTIVGAIAGGVLGNIIAPGGSKTLGTILGAGGGALAGRAIDKNDVRCE